MLEVEAAVNGVYAWAAEQILARAYRKNAPTISQKMPPPSGPPRAPNAATPRSR